MLHVRSRFGSSRKVSSPKLLPYKHNYSACGRLGRGMVTHSSAPVCNNVPSMVWRPWLLSVLLMWCFLLHGVVSAPVPARPVAARFPRPHFFFGGPSSRHQPARQRDQQWHRGKHGHRDKNWAAQLRRQRLKIVNQYELAKADDDMDDNDDDDDDWEDDWKNSDKITQSNRSDRHKALQTPSKDVNLTSEPRHATFWNKAQAVVLVYVIRIVVTLRLEPLVLKYLSVPTLVRIGRRCMAKDARRGVLQVVANELDRRWMLEFREESAAALGGHITALKRHLQRCFTGPGDNYRFGDLTRKLVFQTGEQRDKYTVQFQTRLDEFEKHWDGKKKRRKRRFFL